MRRFKAYWSPTRKNYTLFCRDCKTNEIVEGERLNDHARVHNEFFHQGRLYTVGALRTSGK